MTKNQVLNDRRLEKIHKVLSRIRLIRFISYFPISVFVLLMFSFTILPREWMLLAGPVFEFFAVLAIIGILLWSVIVRLRCPLCGQKFHFWGTDIPRWRNWFWFKSLVIFNNNIFTRKCTSCGLKLNGSNAADLLNKVIPGERCETHKS